MTWRKLLLLVAGFSVVAAGAWDVQAWSIFDHWDMSEDVLEQQGWEEEAQDVVIDCNMATDLLAANWSFFFPSASQWKDDVEELIASADFNTDDTNGFHFDNLNSYDEIAERWQEVEDWAEATVDGLVEEGWDEEGRDAFLCLLGIVHHAVQDFYAHSNWVKLTNPFVEEPYDDDTSEDDVDGDQYPTWDDLQAPGDWDGWSEGTTDGEVIDRLEQSNENPGSGTEDGEGDGLQTGEYPEEDGGPWDHRHPDGAEGAVGEALARRASAQWKEMLLGFLDDDCRDDLLEFAETASKPTGFVDRVDELAVTRFADVLEDVLGSLHPVEQVHSYIEAGELISRIDLAHGLLADFSRGVFSGATAEVTATSEEVIDAVLSAADPETAAREAIEAGDFRIVRLSADVAPCLSSPRRLCLLGNRFEAAIHWSTAAGTAGPGRPRRLTPQSGYFWFFRDTNVEVIVKVLDGCPVNGHYWVFAAGLTNVATRLSVEDRSAGVGRTYETVLREPYRPILDTRALASCP